MADKRCSSSAAGHSVSNGKSNELFFDLKHSVSDGNYLAFVQQFM